MPDSPEPEALAKKLFKITTFAVFVLIIASATVLLI
jgi:hypothetical protein